MLNKLMGTALLLAVVMGATTIPSALAELNALNTPSHTALPNNIQQGDPTTLRIRADESAIPHNGQAIRVYDPDNSPTFPGACPLPGANGGTVYELRDAANPTVKVTYGLPNANPDSRILLAFGTGADFAIVLENGATASAATGRWVDIAGGLGPADNTNKIGIYLWASCGTEGGPSPLNYVGTSQFNVNEIVVGGIISSVDATALFITGLQINALWLIPTLVSMAGVGVFVVTNRKHFKF